MDVFRLRIWGSGVRISPGAPSLSSRIRRLSRAASRGSTRSVGKAPDRHRYWYLDSTSGFTSSEWSSRFLNSGSGVRLPSGTPLSRPGLLTHASSWCRLERPDRGRFASISCSMWTSSPVAQSHFPKCGPVAPPNTGRAHPLFDALLVLQEPAVPWRRPTLSLPTRG